MQKPAFVVLMFRVLFSTLLALMSLSVTAQQKATIYGKITDTKQKPIPSANIKALDLNIITQSDADGNFTISLPANDTVILSFSLDRKSVV